MASHSPFPPCGCLCGLCASTSSATPGAVAQSEEARPDWVYKTAQISAVAQVLFGLISLVGFAKPGDGLLLFLLVADTAVQLIELGFYLLLLRIGKLRTAFRYADWFVTTPLMLISTIAFLDRLGGPLSLSSFFSSRWRQLVGIVLLNASMLAVGLAYELGRLPSRRYLLLGWPPFVAVFVWIAVANASTAGGAVLLAFVFVVWSAYGVAAFLDDVPKNVGYNLLDLFSKNLFGLIVGVYMLVTG